MLTSEKQRVVREALAHLYEAAHELYTIVDDRQIGPVERLLATVAGAIEVAKTLAGGTVTSKRSRKGRVR